MKKTRKRNKRLKNGIWAACLIQQQLLFYSAIFLKVFLFLSLYFLYDNGTIITAHSTHFTRRRLTNFLKDWYFITTQYIHTPAPPCRVVLHIHIFLSSLTLPLKIPLSFLHPLNALITRHNHDYNKRDHHFFFKLFKKE